MTFTIIPVSIAFIPAASLLTILSILWVILPFFTSWLCWFFTKSSVFIIDISRINTFTCSINVGGYIWITYLYARDVTKGSINCSIFWSIPPLCTGWNVYTINITEFVGCITFWSVSISFTSWRPVSTVGLITWNTILVWRGSVGVIRIVTLF